MARRLALRTGVTGYRDQLDRMRRFLGRIVDPARPPDLASYQDDVWSFFQNCWHLKDWVKHDPLLAGGTKDKITAAVEASRTLTIANDMANATKHLELRGARAPAAHAHIQVVLDGGDSRIECVIEVDGVHLLASVVAKSCVAEWERILVAEGLSISPVGT